MILWFAMGLGALLLCHWRMGDQLGDLEGAAGSGAADDGASGGDPLPAGAVAQGVGGDPTGAADPWQGELPDWAREKFGVSKFGELLDHFESGRTQQAEQQQLTSAYQDLIRMYSAGSQQGGVANGGSAKATPAPENNWFGYGSKEAYVAAFNLNPAEVRAREIQAALQQRPELRAQFQEMIGQEVAPLRQAAYKQVLEADYRTLVSKYPDAKDPTVGGANGVVMQFVKGNPWVEQLKQTHPDVNIHEVAFKLGHYDTLVKQLAAFKAQHTERQQAAGTARATVGGRPVQVAAKTHSDAADRAAERLRAAGIEVSDEMVQIAKRGINAGGVQST
jgi:hypothetical protein